MTQRRSLRHTIHVVLNAPAGPTPLGRLINAIIILVILLSTAAYVLSTEQSIALEFSTTLELIELITILLFITEYIARLWVCVEDQRYQRPLLGRLRWIVSPFAVVDLAAILPALLPFIGLDLRILRLVRILRILRILKLARYSRAIQMIGNVLKNQREELIITLSMMLVLVLFSSTALYTFEHQAQPQAFGSIPRAMWWSIVTLTTVGYGDLYPITAAGKIFASIISVLGIGMIALPTGILGAGFVEEIRKERMIKARGASGRNYPHEVD